MITASLVKELREKTGVGMMDCKKALTESSGDISKAIQYLREKGLSKAAKKADRSTTEGCIFIAKNNLKAVIIELNCETDFVASNNDFIETGNTIAQYALDNNITSVKDLTASVIDGKDFSAYLSEVILKVGENINIARLESIEAQGFIESYIHSNKKIGVVIAYSNVLDNEVAKGIAMHIAAANPSFLNLEDVSTEELEKEREIIRNQALNEGRPEQVVDKIVEGKISKFYKENCLIEQEYIKDTDKTIKELLPSGVMIEKFIRFSLT